MNLKTIVISTFLICLSSSGIFGQTESSAVFILPELKISHIDKCRHVTYAFKNEQNRFILADDVLKADTSKYKFETNVNDVLSISIRSGTHMWGSAGMGAAVGLIAGFIIGTRYFSDDPPNQMTGLVIGVSTALVFGAVFGYIGHNSPSFDDYEFHDKDPLAKRNAILKFLKNQNLYKEK